MHSYLKFTNATKKNAPKTWNITDVDIQHFHKVERRILRRIFRRVIDGIVWRRRSNPRYMIPNLLMLSRLGSQDWQFTSREWKSRREYWSKRWKIEEELGAPVEWWSREGSPKKLEWRICGWWPGIGTVVGRACEKPRLVQGYYWWLWKQKFFNRVC